MWRVCRCPTSVLGAAVLLAALAQRIALGPLAARAELRRAPATVRTDPAVLGGHRGTSWGARYPCAPLAGAGQTLHFQESAGRLSMAGSMQKVW